VNRRIFVLLLIAPIVLPGCAFLRGHGTNSAASSSLVSFLYPRGEQPPRQDSIPELRLPLRVGLAFLPSESGTAVGLEAARREELLERIRARFADRKFVSRIEIVPDYYLKRRSGLGPPSGLMSVPGLASVSGFAPVSGFESLEAVQRLYQLDVMALVSYDQVSYQDENNWSLGYLTIVGAYVLKGNRHDVTTLVDLAVVDPASRSILLRAGGTDARHGTTTLASASMKERESRGEGFSGATDQLIENFDAALTKFESDVRAGKAEVRVVSKSRAGTSPGGGGSGGGGALGTGWLLALAAIFWVRLSGRAATEMRRRVSDRGGLVRLTGRRYL
jgi:rhombotail lipoprotein